jgi:nicotinamidase-related amidase
MNNTLLIVDCQHGFINDETRPLIPPITHLQSNYDRVIASRFYNPPVSVFRGRMNWHNVSRDSDEFELAFDPVDGIQLVDKPGYSSMTDDLLNILGDDHDHPIDICGINTEVCVLYTATDLFLANYNIQVLTNYCGSTRGSDYHQAGILTLRHSIGNERVIQY